MSARRTFLALVAGAAAALAAGLGSAAPARAESDPKTFVANLGDEALKTLTETQLDDAERERRFRELFVSHFDVAGIGRTVLGRYWRTATAEEKAEYLKLFEDFIVKTYSSRFKVYSGEQFVVQDLREDRDGYATVKSTVESPAGQDVQVLWRTRQTDGELRIVDVMVEGVSMVITQQRDFASVVQRSGGTVEGLLAALREKTASMH
jgi:phospholipid transport system substrate-binding protein